MDTDGGHPAHRPEPTLADGLSLGDSGEITLTTQAGDVIRGWVGPSGTAHVDIDAHSGFADLTGRELTLLRAMAQHLAEWGTWNHERPGQHYQLTPEVQR